MLLMTIENSSGRNTPISIAVTSEIWPGRIPSWPVVLGSITSSATPSKTFLFGAKTFNEIAIILKIMLLNSKLFISF